LTKYTIPCKIYSVLSNLEMAKLNPMNNFEKLRIDDYTWDYRGESTKTYTQSIHSYPAMMIPQVANRLINMYSSKKDVLLDPFCGSGSVLVEARISERNSWGIDLNPLAILIARVKTTPIKPKIIQEEFANVLRKIGATGVNVPIPVFYNLHFWFKESVIYELAKIRFAIDTIEQKDVRDFFKVIFSEVTRISSNSRNGEFKLFRYSEEKLKSFSPDPLKLFINQTLLNIDGIKSFYSACPKNAWCKIIEADSTSTVDEIPPSSVDIIVTSPPYGDSRTTVAYGQFSRLSAQWLGLAPDRVQKLDNELLGGKPVRINNAGNDLDIRISRTLKSSLDYIANQDLQRSRQVEAFYIGLAKSLHVMSYYLKYKGYACIVIGNRRVKGLQLQTDLITCELAQAHGLAPQQIIVRNIPNKTMPLRNSPTNIKGALEDTMRKEYIVILRKECCLGA
jgi:site-specific DNA-methyltransferase (cytosine-N4-specific)